MTWREHWKDLPRFDLEEADGPRLQMILDSLSHGGCLVLPPGRFAISQTLRIPSHVWFRGSGNEETTLWLADHANCHILTNDSHGTGNTFLALSDIRLAGNYAKQRRPKNAKALIFACGLYLKNTKQAYIENVIATDIRQIGLHFSKCASVEISDFAADTIGWSGISTTGTDDIVIRRSSVTNAGRDDVHSGIHLDGGSGSVIEAEVRNVSGNAITLASRHGPLRHSIIHSTCATSMRGLSLTGSADHPLEHIRISGNFSGNREVGVMISNAEGIFLTNSEIRHNGKHGLLLQGRRGGRNCTISGNRFAGNGTSVTEIHGSGSNYFIGNIEEDRVGDGSPRNTAATAAAKPARGPRISKPAASEIAQHSDLGQHSYLGTCSICGAYGRFPAAAESIRESYPCGSCKSSLRYRGQAEAIIRFFGDSNAVSLQDLVERPHFLELAIYEPALGGPLMRHLNNVPGYERSYFWESVRPGTEHKGIVCQDLTSLTYADDSFDLVITSDVLEHVRRPYEAFGEIHRVLKPGGMHIFSLPVEDPMPRETVFRVDTASDDDVLTLPARYHVAGDKSPSLVYTDFGADMLSRLAGLGLPSQALPLGIGDAELGRLLTFASTKTSSASAKTSSGGASHVCLQ